MAQNNVYTFLKEYREGELIFREGTPSKCMYEVQKGRVDLYANYGTPEQKKLAEIGPERFFGEMGMVEGLPRSATAVAGVEPTILAEVTWDVFGLYFKKKPARVVQIMQQRGDRLRITTKASMDLRNAVEDAIKSINEHNTESTTLNILRHGIYDMDETLKSNK